MASFPVHRKVPREEFHQHSPIAAAGFLVCQHHVSNRAEDDAFRIDERALIIIPDTRVLLHLGKCSSPLDPLDPGSKNTPSHLEGSLDKCCCSRNRKV